MLVAIPIRLKESQRLQVTLQSLGITLDFSSSKSYFCLILLVQRTTRFNIRWNNVARGCFLGAWRAGRLVWRRTGRTGRRSVNTTRGIHRIKNEQVVRTRTTAVAQSRNTCHSEMLFTRYQTRAWHLAFCGISVRIDPPYPCFATKT